MKSRVNSFDAEAREAARLSPGILVGSARHAANWPAASLRSAPGLPAPADRGRSSLAKPCQTLGGNQTKP